MSILKHKSHFIRIFKHYYFICKFIFWLKLLQNRTQIEATIPLIFLFFKLSKNNKVFLIKYCKKFVKQNT